MGTRNLTCVYLDGEYKVAQYGQWDGYPEGVGSACLDFLRKMDEDKFKAELRKRKPVPEGYIGEILAELGCKDGWMSMEQSARFRKQFPEFHRDTAADILKLIMRDEVGPYLRPEITFAADSLWCEWCYVIDLDMRTFEVYGGFNKKPLTEKDRFFFLEEVSEREHRGDDQYHPVKLVAAWSLNALPTEEDFLNAFKEEVTA